MEKNYAFMLTKQIIFLTFVLLLVFIFLSTLHISNVGDVVYFQLFSIYVS